MGLPTTNDTCTCNIFIMGFKGNLSLSTLFLITVYLLVLISSLANISLFEIGL